MNPVVHTLTLSPSGRQLRVEDGRPLQDVLFAQGVEFPCGGRGRCKGCRVKVPPGALPALDAERSLLSAGELAAGWRLACLHRVTGDLQLELAQWEMPILADQTAFGFTPRAGVGVAVDLGTTTVVAQLLDLQSGRVLAVRSALNAQARHGADVMSRIEFALAGGQTELTQTVRGQIGEMVGALMQHAPDGSLTQVFIVGNTAMHHLFCGVNVAPLARHPFEPVQAGRMRFGAGELGWRMPATATVDFLPCLGGFVGSDILAGIVATGLHESQELRALIDLGTNGEIVVGQRGRLLCASTAAGPAFEGARITMGMRAANGAINVVQVAGAGVVCHVIGGGVARGLCGSGLVDAVAAGLDLHWIEPSGRMTVGGTMPLADGVTLAPCDVREFQLAKGAIAAGLRLLTARLGKSLEDIERVYLAGAFGNYVNRDSACRVGLINVPLERIEPAGNTALLGAKRALFEEWAKWEAIRRQVEHVVLNEDPQFQDVYAEEMRLA